MSDIAKELDSFLKSPLGVEMIRVLKEDLHGRLIEDAQNAENQDIAFGLLKEARGVIKSVEHLQSVAAIRA